MFTESPCNLPGSCDFETGPCFYTNSKADNFDWLLGSATTEEEGPPTDHTTGGAFGMYTQGLFYTAYREKIELGRVGVTYDQRSLISVFINMLGTCSKISS